MDMFQGWGQSCVGRGSRAKRVNRGSGLETHQSSALSSRCLSQRGSKDWGMTLGFTDDPTRFLPGT